MAGRCLSPRGGKGGASAKACCHLSLQSRDRIDGTNGRQRCLAPVSWEVLVFLDSLPKDSGAWLRHGAARVSREVLVVLSSQFVPHTDKGLWNQAAARCRTGVPHSVWSHCVLRTRNDFEVWPPEGDEYLWKNFCEGKTEIVKVRNPRLGADFNQFRGTE